MNAILKTIVRIHIFVVAISSVILATTMDSRAALVSYDYIGATSTDCRVNFMNPFDCHVEGMFTVDDSIVIVAQTPTSIMLELIRDSDNAVLDSYSGPWDDPIAQLDVEGNILNFIMRAPMPPWDLSFGELGWNWGGGPSEMFTSIGAVDPLITAKAVSPVPAPAALPLFLTGLASLGWFGWRRKRKDQLAAA